MLKSEVSKKTGLSAKAIRLYIEEGLLSPSRDENGYINFSQSDVKLLLKIKILRDLELSVFQIRLILNEPAIIPFILCHKRIQLQRRIIYDQKRVSTLSHLLSDILEKPSDVLDQDLTNEEHMQTHPVLDPHRPISEEDADLLLSLFWALFGIEQRWDDYQHFLWNRMKQKLMENQQDLLKKYRNRQFEDGSRQDSMEVLLHALVRFRKVYSELGKMNPDELVSYFEHACQTILKNLNKPSFARYWKENYETLPEISAFFNADMTETMIQFSPIYTSWYNNQKELLRLFRSHWESQEGTTLRCLTEKILGDAFDIRNDDHISQLLIIIPNTITVMKTY